MLHFMTRDVQNLWNNNICMSEPLKIQWFSWKNITTCFISWWEMSRTEPFLKQQQSHTTLPFEPRGAAAYRLATKKKQHTWQHLHNTVLRCNHWISSIWRCHWMTLQQEQNHHFSISPAKLWNLPICQWPMASGQWPVTSDQWPVASGKNVCTKCLYNPTLS